MSIESLTQEGLRKLIVIMLEGTQAKDSQPLSKGDFLLGVVALKMFDLETRLAGLEDRLSEIVGRI
jgi:hypothetical protein